MHDADSDTLGHNLTSGKDGPNARQRRRSTLDRPPLIASVILVAICSVSAQQGGDRPQAAGQTDAAGPKAPAPAARPLPAFASKVGLHNFGGAVATEDGNAIQLCRLPAEVREKINETAREKYKQPAASEIRFVLNPGEKFGNVEITLEPEGGGQVFADFFCGDYQYFNYNRAVRRKTVIKYPTHGDFVARMDRLPRGHFANDVCRIVLRGGPVKLVDVQGDIRPPKPDELPPAMISYGTSITQGASRADLAYNALTARALGFDLVNLGTSGSAFCEPEIAEYIAEQDWGLCVLELSVNMLGRGFTVEQFRERATKFVDTIAAARPDSPVVCISLFPYFGDVDAGPNAEKVKGYRKALEEVCKAGEHKNVHFIQGTDLLKPTGLTQDVLHPSDHGMIEISQKLSARIREILKAGKTVK